MPPPALLQVKLPCVWGGKGSPPPRVAGGFSMRDPTRPLGMPLLGTSPADLDSCSAGPGEEVCFSHAQVTRRPGGRRKKPHLL